MQARYLVFFKDGRYNEKLAESVKNQFNEMFTKIEDEFSPVMLKLTEQNNLGEMIYMMEVSLNVMALVFIVILAVVLWNAGLMNSIRRYGEIGVRLAMGEGKKHLYFSIISESVIIGLIGSAIGTLLGIAISLYFNNFGLDIGAYNKDSSILSESVIYTYIDLKTCLWGFLPGLSSTVIGASLAGLVIFKRKTAQLFKELEV